MRILAIESSAKSASCALLCDGELEAMNYQNVGLTHSQTLMPMIESMMKSASRTMADVDIVAASHGPGSFTGVRIGVSTALGLAAGANKLSMGVSTLEAMSRLTAHTGALTVCAMDARRSEVYAAMFLDGERLCDDCAVPASEFAARAVETAKKLGKSVICLGDGAELCYNQIKDSGVEVALAPPHLLRQSAVGVAMLAADRLSAGEDFPPLRPVYLRASQAERMRANNQAQNQN